MWLLLNSLGCFLLQVYGQYYIAGDAEDRVSAVQTCTTLARPNITFSRTGNTVNLDVDTLDDGQRAWVGYTMAAEIFHYIGCVKVADVNDKNIPHEQIDTTHDPGQCYSACKTSTIFGLRTTLKDRDCFCFNTDVVNQTQDTRNRCNRKCNNKLFACGGKNHLSLYTKAHFAIDKSNNSKCLGYAKPDGYNWMECNGERYSVCFKDELDKSPGIKSWEKAMAYCFHKGEHPISPWSDENRLTDYDYWTAYINTLVITGLKDTGVDTGVYKYGYIERNGEDIFLNFTSDLYTPMAALCETAGVYVAVPLVILASVGVAVVVTVVCYRKIRRHKPGESKGPVLPRSSLAYNYCDEQLSDVNAAEGATGYANYVNTAFENSANLKNGREEAKTKTCSDNYTNDTNAYKSELNRSDNIYNTANYNTDGDDYDHIGHMNISAQDRGHYDSTAGVMKPNDDSDYDTTNVSSSRNGRRDEVKTADDGHYDTTTGVTRANDDPDYDTTNLSASRSGRKDGTGQTDVHNNYGYASCT